jgi:hypothetical protein
MKNETIHEIYFKTMRLIGLQVKVDHIADYSSNRYLSENKELEDVKYIIEPVDEFYIYITREPIAIEIREVKVYDIEKGKEEMFIAKLHYEDNTIILFFEKESLKMRALSFFSW